MLRGTVRRASWTGVLKTVVSRATGQPSNGALVASGSPSASSALTSLKEKVSQMFEEKEWTCHCGHKFRAAGEWYPTEPAQCEAPGCPNPSYYIDGPGRAMLEAGGTSSIAGEAPKKLPDKTGMGGRFK